MSEVDFESHELSGDEAGAGDKLVPVSEAIRYRKRAQNAEKQAVELEQQLRVSEVKNEHLAGELDSMKTERELVSRLTAAGVVDLEAAVLVAKSRMVGQDGDVDSVIEQMKNEKRYLFGVTDVEQGASMTAGARERAGSGRKVLESAAKRAALSGSRSDVQEYLKVRRQYI